MRRERLVLAAKLPLVLAVETAMAPPMLLAALLLGRRAEPALAIQNAIRRRALRWLLPETSAAPRTRARTTTPR